ncbi:putative GTP-binding protein 6 isoform X2 [Brienomyrus brachyistius]|uniref:putative GTP-binding protein 6 isoform X2 n=1 Tax=Brienomyrus brachyistius TaxID=42636 RepID=UPI0020B46002|nr:putative GTP-binding protein 6 isoform X2 [Brienomyrus brachyistius]
MELIWKYCMINTSILKFFTKRRYYSCPGLHRFWKSRLLRIFSKCNEARCCMDSLRPHYTAPVTGSQVSTARVSLNQRHIRCFSTTTSQLKSKKTSHDEGAIREDDENFGEDVLDDSEVEELFLQQVPTRVGADDHRIVIVHPDVKWGSKKPQLTTADLMMAEAVGLVNTLQNWTVVDKIILSTKTPEKRTIFGKGNFKSLTERIRRLPQITAVFMNVERLNPLSEEAKLQISLAEIPLLRSRLKDELSNLDQQGGGSRYIMGSGETFLEVQQRLLREREMKIRSALEKLRKKRHLLRSQRKSRDFPIVSVIGYTNCGKTTLIKALTGDRGLQPRDQLFATLDVTVHGGQLPSRMPVLFVDTIGFLSQLPHQLIDSFSATLEDVSHSDLIVHVRDISHPETLSQKVNVLSILKDLQIPERLMNSIVEVHNKIDLVDSYQPTEQDAIAISALKEQGLQELKGAIETAVMKATGRQVLTLKVDLSSSQLSWLYKEAVVQDVDVVAEEGTALVQVIISTAAYGRYRKLFLTN